MTRIGVCVGQTAWYPTFFSKAQIDLLALKTNHIRLMLNKTLWESGDLGNPLHIPYKAYITQLAVWIKAAKMHLQVDLTREANDDLGTETLPSVIIIDPAKCANWINWGKDVVSTLQPDSLTIMNEPNNPLWPNMAAALDWMKTKYIPNIVTPSVQAYRAIKPDLILVIPAAPFFRPCWMAGLIDNYPNSYVSLHLYYQKTDTYFGTKYMMGDLANAKTSLFAYLDALVFGRTWYQFNDPTGLTWNKVWIDEFGVYDYRDWPSPGVPTEANWQQFLKDFYEFCKTHTDVAAQYQVGNKYYEILDPATGYTTYTPYGKTWSDFGATIETLYVLDVWVCLGGTTVPSGIQAVASGTVRIIRATAAADYKFNGWQVQTGTAPIVTYPDTVNPLTLTIIAATEVMPLFNPVPVPPTCPEGTHWDSTANACVPNALPSAAARTVGPFGVPSALLHQLWRLRERVIRPEIHKKLHPLV